MWPNPGQFAVWPAKKTTMSIPRLAPSAAVPRRPGLARALLLLGLLGLLWSWHLAPAQAHPADSEWKHFLPELAAELAQDVAAELGPSLGCRKPATPKSAPPELLLHEVDQAVLMRWQLCRLLTQAPPPSQALPSLPEIGPQPLLRPPTARA